VTSAITSGNAEKRHFARRVLYASLIFTAVLAVAGLLWLTASYLLLFFAAVLLAIMLDTITEGIKHVLPVPRSVRLIISILLVISVFAALGLVIPSILAQTPEFARYVEQWVESIQRWLSEWAPVRESLESGESGNLISLLPDPAGILGGAAQLLGTVLGAATGLALILIAGIYLAVDPSRYYNGTLSLLNPESRETFAKIASDANMVLRRWLFGQILMMLIIGTGSYIVLSLLEVPLALLLSFIAGLTAFVPYIGPLIGGGIMVLVAATQDLRLGLMVFAFYMVLQILDDYFLTPMIQSRAIFVPPVIVILSQVIFGVLFGLLGIALATPLAAIIGVIVSRLYFHEPVKERADT
jgi:predicted PurR-regulated permease PerM